MQLTRKQVKNTTKDILGLLDDTLDKCEYILDNTKGSSDNEINELRYTIYKSILKLDDICKDIAKEGI